MKNKEEYQVIDIKKIKPSPRNYRRSMDKQALEDLTASVKAKGILQPVLVRPIKGNGSFELVAGHRRHKAASMAGLDEIPTIVRTLTDEEALEIQVIENSQREDPNPMDEALGFKELIKIGKHTAETLATKLDRSPSYVTKRLRLLKLPKPAQNKLISGEIAIGHALLITSLKNTGDQKEYLEEIIDEDMTVSMAKRSLQDYSVMIKDAVFDIDKCNKCPYLSNNQTDLFPDAKKTGECMDRSCYFTRTYDHYQAIIKARKKDGFTIITDQDKAMGHEKYNSRNSCFIPPDTKYHYGTIKPKRYKSECMKCFEHHTFYLYVEKPRHSSHRKEVQFGEICFDKKCLLLMNKVETGSDKGASADSGNSQASEWKIEERARDCRNRFLRKELPAIVRKDSTLSTRLIIYHILENHKSFKGRSEIIKKYYPKYIDGQYEHKIYAVINEFPKKKLPEALVDILTAAIDTTDPSTLLLMTKEAILDMKKDFAVDQEFLQKKTISELVEYAEQFRASLDLDLQGKSRKSDIINVFLERDLRGILPAECVKVCRIEQIDEDAGIETCIKCKGTFHNHEGDFDDNDMFTCDKCLEIGNKG